jgi:hypothetical protein
MKASELIHELQSQIDVYGDLPVCDADGYEMHFVEECEDVIRSGNKYKKVKKGSYFKID